MVPALTNPTEDVGQRHHHRRRNPSCRRVNKLCLAQLTWESLVHAFLQTGYQVLRVACLIHQSRDRVLNPVADLHQRQ